MLNGILCNFRYKQSMFRDVFFQFFISLCLLCTISGKVCFFFFIFPNGLHRSFGTSRALYELIFWTEVITSHEIFLAVDIEAAKQKKNDCTNVFVFIKMP